MARKKLFTRIERLGMLSLVLFIAAWLAAPLMIRVVMGSSENSLWEKDVMRRLNDSLYQDAANIHLHAFVDKVRFLDKDSITPDGRVLILFDFRIKSQKYGKSWHGGTLETDSTRSYSGELSFSLKD